MGICYYQPMEENIDMWEEAKTALADEGREISGPVLWYTAQVIDHFQNPRHVADDFGIEADGLALIGDPACGDQMKLWIRVKGERIAEIAFRSFGCPGAIATSSMLCSLADGKSLKDALAITDDDVVSALGGIPENKKHCSLLGVKALQAAIADYRSR